MTEFLTSNLVQLLSYLGIAIAWIVSQKNRVAELDKLRSEAEFSKGTAVEQMQKAYTQFVADRTAEYAEIATENKNLSSRLKEMEDRERSNARDRGELSGKLEALNKQRQSDQKTIEDLQCQIAEYKHEIEGYKKQIQDYQTTLEQYKKELERYQKI